MSKPVYTMSTAGGCAKALAAGRLGYEPLPETGAQLRIMTWASKHEKMIADDLGLELEEGGQCLQCANEFGNERYGIHVEYETPVIRLVGHLDRRAKINGDRVPVEIKALGRFTFDKFRNKLFDAFPEYGAQEVCYLEAEGKPGLYVVGNRDTGELLKYTIPYNYQCLDLAGFEPLPLGIELVKFEDIVEKLHWVEFCIQDNILPDAEVNESDQCRYCRVRYLCTKPEVGISIDDIPSLTEAAELWKEGKEFEEKAKERIEQARQVFLNHAKRNEIPKYRVSGLSISYSGEKTRTYLDEKWLKENAPKELIEKATKTTKPYPDIRIYTLKGE